MNKLHALALCGLAAPMLTMGAGSVLAQQSTYKDSQSRQESTQRTQDSNRTGAAVTKDARDQTRSMRTDASSSKDHGGYRNGSRNQSHGYMASTPQNGMKMSNLMGAEVKTSRDEEVGNVSDLLIDSDGQIVAVVVGVGGILGMGEREVAIGWDDVTKSTRKSTNTLDSDDTDLRIDATHKDLESAPEYEAQN